jgi:hypothetical protein
VLVQFFGGAHEDWKGQLIVLDAVQREYNRQMLTVMAVQASPELADLRLADYAKSRNFTCFVLMEGADVAREKYKVRATPMTIWIDARGKVLGVEHGWQELETLVRQAREIIGR